jgi:hypothetical protein
VVIGEIRPANAQVAVFAARLASRVQALLDAGVPPDHVTLVGASKGGTITLSASRQLHRAELRVVILAGMFQGLVDDPLFRPCGAVLSIHDRAGQLSVTPDAFFAGNDCVSEHRTVVADLNLGHGLLYAPHEAWVAEVVRWSGIGSQAP